MIYKMPSPEMHDTWLDNNDFMDDIWAFSEMEEVGRRDVQEPPPMTILEYRAQMEANNTGSVYDTPDPVEEGVTYIISGRGRGGISTIFRPGVSQLSDNLVTEDIQRKIRQVSGLGYSNALIEQSVRAMTSSDDKNTDSPFTATLSPQLPSSRSPTCITPELCPADLGNNSSTSSSVSSSPLPKPPENNSMPLPLSLMRKRALEERAKAKEKEKEMMKKEADRAKEANIRENSKVETWEGQERRPIRSPRSPRRSPRSGNVDSWRSCDLGSTSEDGSWRRRDGNTANRFFKQRTNGFHLDSNDFPALR